MHAAYARDALNAGGEGQFRASFPEAVTAPAPPPAPLPVLEPSRSAYGERARPNWPAIAVIVALHALLLFALVTFDVIEIGRKPPPPLVVDLLAEPPAPPPPPADVKPEVPVKPVQPQIVAPPPVVQTPAPPPAVAVVAEAPPPQAAVVAPPAPKAAVTSAPVSVDLSTKMVSAKPPRYPTESLRKKEQGTVVLRLLLGLDGSVSEIGVARSSGFERLDKAALDAVRRWRWSPTVQAGQPVQVRGMVEIPFVLQA